MDAIVDLIFDTNTQLEFSNSAFHEGSKAAVNADWLSLVKGKRPMIDLLWHISHKLAPVEENYIMVEGTRRDMWSSSLSGHIIL